MSKIYRIARRDMEQGVAGGKAEEYLIEASNRAQAMRVVAETVFNVELASQQDIVRLVSSGVTPLAPPSNEPYPDPATDELSFAEERQAS